MSDLISPETIPFLPLPNAEVYPLPQQATQSTKAVSSPATVPITRPPQKIIAMETVSANFDTYLKRIIGEFKFSPLGAIQLGEYVNGVQGDMRLSAAGLQARNVNGDTTILFDNLTGNAYFMGTIQANSVIAGAVDVKDSNIQIDGTNGRMVWYYSGVPGIVIGNAA